MKSKVDYAYEILKKKIINFELLPLTDISEDELQKELHISRTPVREAIQRLAKEGFVRIYSRKATIVSDLTLDLINHVYEVRLLNEPYIAKLACRYIPEQEIDAFQEKFLKLKSNYNSKENREYYIDLDKQLHEMLIENCKNVFLLDLFKVINDHSQRIRIFTSRKNTSYSKSIDEHLQILAALKEHDEAAVEEAVRNHIITARSEAFEFYN